MSNKKIKVVDLFCGVGGLSYGFAKDDKFQIVAANEILPNMAKAYELNHPTVKVYCKDIKYFGIHDLRKDFNIKEGEIDLIVGGPPCQAYSTAGKRLIDDPRGKLFQKYYRVLKEINPKAFIFENVRGLLSMDRGELFNTIISLFKSLNYRVSFKVLNMDHNAPINNEKLIKIMKQLPDGGTPLDLPENMRPKSGFANT